MHQGVLAVPGQCALSLSKGTITRFDELSAHCGHRACLAGLSIARRQELRHDHPTRHRAEVLVHSSRVHLVLSVRPSSSWRRPARPPEDFDALFAAVDEDPRDALDGVRDTANMPVEDEPQRVRDDLDAFAR